MAGSDNQRESRPPTGAPRPPRADRVVLSARDYLRSAPEDAPRPSPHAPAKRASRPSARPAPTLYAGGNPGFGRLRVVALVAGALAVCTLLAFGATSLFAMCSAPAPQQVEEQPAEAAPEAPPTPEERLAALPALEESQRAELELPAGEGLLAFAPAPAADGGDAAQPVLSEASRAAVDQALAPFEENERSFGFALVDLGTGRGIARNVDEVFYGASSFKGPYCAYFCESQIETGALTRDDFIASGVMNDSGVFSSQGSDRVGTMVESAILFSSNDTYGALRSDYSDEELASHLEELGVNGDLAYDTWFPRFSVRDAARLWLDVNEYLESDTETAQWLGSLFEQDETSFIRAALDGEGVRVLSKPGWSLESLEGGEYNALCDAGIVVKDGRRYLFCIMSNAPHTTPNVELFQDVIAAVFAARGDLA